MMTKRMELANACHNKKFNCAQSVLLAFGDKTGLDEKTARAIAGGMGGGVGGCKEEICGALSGAVLALGMLLPHVEEDDQAAKERIYGTVSEFRRRFTERFGYCRCGDLLNNEASEADRKWADEIGAERVCPVFIMETVRMLEDYLQELGL